MAIPAATLPIFQIIFLILYLKLAERVRCLFEACLELDEKSKAGAL